MIATLPTGDSRSLAGKSSLDAILAPRSIAVIGASRRSLTMGHQILHNLIHLGYTGTVYPVNPFAKAVCSVRAYPSVRDIPEPVDMAVVVVPRDQVPAVVDDCGEAGVRGLVMISAGFREIGREGAEKEQLLQAQVRRYGMRMIGPNCMGVINASPDVMMNATFAPQMPPFGHCAFVSQSGALGVSVINSAREYGIGISQFVSIGNNSDVSGNDLLEAWEHDEAVKVILMYVENFGNPAKFLEIASRLSQTKPIIAVKGGRTKAGALAAVSHTGALAASDIAVDALLTQAGVLRAVTMEEMFDMAIGFGAHSLPKSRRTAVVTNAGGPGILAADALEGFGLELVQPSQQSVDAIQKLLPPGVPVRNPLDLIASATPAGYRSSLSTLLKDPAIDCVLSIFIPPLGIDQEEVAQAIAGAARENPEKPVLAVLMGRQGLSETRAQMANVGIPTYMFPESAARAIGALNRHRENAERVRRPSPDLDVDTSAARSVIDSARREGRTRLSEVQALALLQTYGVPVVATKFAATRAAAVAAAEEIGYPLVLKVVSPEIVHKSDVGGVVLDIRSAEEAGAAYDNIVREASRRAPQARLQGVLVARQLRGGRETIVGITRDPSFGVMAMFGLGGVFTEVLRDVVFRFAPLTQFDAKTMVNGIRGAAILSGFRGSPAVDRVALQDVVRRVAQLAVDFPEIAELDANPVLAFESEVVAVDCRVVLSEAKS